MLGEGGRRLGMGKRRVGEKDGRKEGRAGGCEELERGKEMERRRAEQMDGRKERRAFQDYR
jgi:hypothetical protein